MNRRFPLQTAEDIESLEHPGLLNLSDGKICGLSIKSIDNDMSMLNLQKSGTIIAITVLNEPGSALRTSLIALADNIEHLLVHHQGAIDTTVTICIIVDGQNFLSETVLKVFENFGFFSAHDNDTNDAIVFKNQLSPRAVREACKINNTDQSIEHQWQDIYLESQAFNEKDNNSSANTTCASTKAIQLLICVKRSNLGKLDSHWWYYCVFCPHIYPNYCIQMDVGTAPAQDAMLQIYRIFENNRNVAAIAPNIYTPRPTSLLNLLEVWQYGNFAKTAHLDWPSEVLCGYLSVIPGQFSAIRWCAIDFQQVRDKHPLDVYFKGLGPLEPFESTLYLAEDRVLCSELVTQHEQQWQLTTSEDALAITDPCRSWEELLRQRKRWCAGYITCRVSFISKTINYLQEARAPLATKSRMITAACYHAIQVLLDWFIPALLLLAYYDLSTQALRTTLDHVPLHKGLQLLIAVNFSMIALQFFVSIRGTLDNFAKFTLSLSLAAQILFLVVTSVFVLLSGDWLLSGLLVAAIFAAQPIVAALKPKNHAFNLLKISLPNIVARPAISFMMWMYAICNSHDNSWGTKGLAKPHYEKDNHKSISNKLSRFRTFRRNYVCLWIISNTLMGALLFFLAAIANISATSLVLLILAANAVLSMLLALTKSLIRKSSKVTSK